MTTKRELMQHIRRFCSECMGGPRATELVWPVSNVGDIDTCPATDCVWHQFRHGKDPAPHPSHVKRGRILARSSVMSSKDEA